MKAQSHPPMNKKSAEFVKTKQNKTTNLTLLIEISLSLTQNFCLDESDLLNFS